MSSNCRIDSLTTSRGVVETTIKSDDKTVGTIIISTRSGSLDVTYKTLQGDVTLVKDSQAQSIPYRPLLVNSIESELESALRLVRNLRIEP